MYIITPAPTGVVLMASNAINLLKSGGF